MGHQPALVDRIARETSAEMVVDAALADAVKRELDRTEIALVVHALSGAPQELEHRRLGKLRRPAHAAVDRIDHPGDLAGRAIELGRGDHDAPFRPRALREARHQRAAILLHALWVLAEDALDLAQQVDEGGLSIARSLGKIGAAPEWLAVGAFLAVDFDVDEELVHYLRGRRILEALVCHDVTPMTGGIPD